MPSKKKDDGTWENVVDCPNREAREALEEAVLEKMANAGVRVAGTAPQSQKASNAPKETTTKPAQKNTGMGIPKDAPF